MSGGVREHDQAVAGMFGRIARFYDLLNHVLSLGIDCWWRRELAASVWRGPAHRFLDLAAGTLDVSFALRRRHPEYKVLAMDFCHPMLALGQKKLERRLETGVLPVAADGKRLPLPDNSVDSVTIAFGIRNILPRAEALKEMHRVLVPGGRACILEFGSGRDKIWGGLYNLYLTRLLPSIGRLVSRDSGCELYCESAGITASDGAVCDKGIIKAVSEETGRNISHCRSTRADPALYDASDIIITVRDEHAFEIIKAFPQIKDKVFSLSTFAASCGLVFKDANGRLVSVSIPDPRGENEATYSHTVKALKAWLELLFPYLIKAVGAERA